MKRNSEELFTFELLDPFKKTWKRARWKATRADIEARGGRVIEGTGWTPKDVDGRDNVPRKP